MNKTSPLFKLLKMKTAHSKQLAVSKTHVKIDLVECWKVFNLLFVDSLPRCMSIISFFLLSSVYGIAFLAL